MNGTFTFLLLIFLLQACNNVADNQHKSENNDNEIAFDEPFDTFKTNLQQAVKEKNLVKLKPLFADYIMESNDGCAYPGCSQEDFFDIYFNPETSPINDWQMMSDILRFGFEQTKTYYRTEDSTEVYYTAPAYPDSTFNPEKEAYIIREWTYIYEKPTAASKPITKVVHLERLDCICDYSRDDAYITQNDTVWIKVKVPGMKYGYTPLQHTSNSIEKHIIVKKINGRWKIIEYYHTPGC